MNISMCSYELCDGWRGWWGSERSIPHVQRPSCALSISFALFLYLLRTKENRFGPSIPMQSPYPCMFYGSLDLLMCLRIAVNCEAGTCRVNGSGQLGFPVNPRDRLHQQAVEIRKQSMETRRTCLAPTNREPLKIRLKEAERLERAHGIGLVVCSTQSIIGFGSSSMQRWLTSILYIYIYIYKMRGLYRRGLLLVSIRIIQLPWTWERERERCRAGNRRWEGLPGLQGHADA